MTEIGFFNILHTYYKFYEDTNEFSRNTGTNQDSRREGKPRKDQPPLV